MPKRKDIKKIMVIGSGPIVIGQAAEFDYAGTQACLALKEEGYEVILVNSNPATIMTDTTVADKVYMEPLTLEYVAKILRFERPDALIPGLGGQTGLNLAMQLEKKGVLSECQVELLGTSAQSIECAEDREKFKELCESLGEPVLPSMITHSAEEAVSAAEKIGYPVVLRPAFTLGGTGGGFADNEEQLREIMKNALRLSPVRQVLVEKSIRGFKEIEYEVVRDANDTAIAVCNMEKPRPCGNTHGRQHSGRAKSDAYKQGISAFERQRAQNHTGVENRGRLQRTVRAGPAVLRLFFDRGKSESFPFVGFGKQGERIPHCARVRKNSGGYASRRNNACKHSRVLRAGS